MLTFRTLVMFAAVTIATVEGPILLRAQVVDLANQPDSVLIQVSLQKSSYAIGEKPIAVVTFTSSNGIWFPNDLYHERIHVTSKDGEPPKTGGTGALARRAYEGGIPVVWLSTLDGPTPPGSDKPTPRLISGFKDDVPIATEADCTKGPLLAALIPIFAAPSTREGSPTQRSARAGLEGFLRERWHRCSFAFGHDFLTRIVRRKVPRLAIPSPPLEKRLNAWDKFIDQAPETRNLMISDQSAGDLRAKLKTTLLERFAWA